MKMLRSERVSLLLARRLPKTIGDYYRRVDESIEEQIPSSRVVKIEQLEPLGLAIQMFCLYLRSLQCDYPSATHIMEAAWRTLDLTPEVRDDVAAQARGFYQQMLAYPVFRETATVSEMITERCEAILPVLQKAPELREYVEAVSRCFSTLQQFTIG